MRRFVVAVALAAGMTFAFAMLQPAFADNDPTVNQIYAAASSGRLDQAQQMISQVLTDHPNSARAHYVQAELYARVGKISLARSELATAERLNPGLPFANPQSVRELKAQIGSGGTVMRSAVGSAPPAAQFPWGPVLILTAAVGILWMVFRRRRPAYSLPAGGTGAPGANGPGGYGPGMGPGYGPAPMGGGIGSGIAGGLASGLAVGAGVVAGEQLARHFLDGGRGSEIIPPAEAGESQLTNSDMGGSDFGMTDPGSGWDDGGGDLGGGGDWS